MGAVLMWGTFAYREWKKNVCSDNRDIRLMNKKRKSFQDDQPVDVTTNLVDAVLKGECAKGVCYHSQVPSSRVLGVRHWLILLCASFLTVTASASHIPCCSCV